MEENISIILKPLRKLILDEFSFGIKSNVFYLPYVDHEERFGSVMKYCHVHKFIIVEKQIALKSLKKKIKLQKRNEVNENKNEEVEDNIIKFLPTQDEVMVANNAIQAWEKSASELINLVQEGKGQEILDSLIAASKLNGVCKRGIVMCLLILIKKSEDLNIIANGYSAVAQICRTSKMFLLFIELCKIYATANSKNSGWGRGMRRAIRNWYLQWEPRLLALEVTRYSSAYTWSHKDVLKMAHISLNNLPTETQAVLNFIFSGFESTKQKYGSEENAKDFIQLLEILHKGSGETNADVLLERGNNILAKFGSISISDFPTQALNDSKVMSFLLENGTPQLVIEALANTSLFKLISSNAELRALLMKQVEREGFCGQVDLFKTIIAYNNCRRISAELLQPDDTTKEKQWKKNAAPNPDKAKKLRTAVPRPKPVDEVFAALGKLVTEGSKDIARMEKKITFFVDLDPSLDDFIAVSPEDPISKEMRGTQAISLLILSLASCHSSLGSALPLLAPKMNKTEDSKFPSTFTSLQSGLSKLAKTNTDQLNVSESLKAAIRCKASICVYIYSKLCPRRAKELRDQFIQTKSQNSASELRLVVWMFNDSLDITDLQHSDLLFLFGFNRSTLPTIRAFTNGLL